MKELLPNLDPNEWADFGTLDFDNVPWPTMCFDFSEDMDALPPLDFDLSDEFNDPWFDDTTLNDTEFFNINI